MLMTIWVDADACPVAVREILYRAALREELDLIFVANRPVNVANHPRVRHIQVAGGFDVADDEIVARLSPGDLVITGDIPLAAEVVAKEAAALSPRGELFTKDNIKARLNMRDFLETMRASGVNTSGPPPYSQEDRKAFAGQLDRLLMRAKKAQ